MMQESRDEAVERLYTRLAEALQQSRREFDVPVTVAEIYQELVPYRLVRSEVGFGMNADYEHALLRLLAGEAGRVRLEPDTARETIRRELRDANPNVGLYRDYAACDVWVQAPVEASHVAEAVAELLGDVFENEDADEAAIFSLVDDLDPEPYLTEVAGDDEAAAETEAPARRGAEADHCTYCDSPLPTQRPVRFCPYCGGDQTTRPCGECGEPLEPGWMFCIACGGARDSVQ
ncbi:MAG: zinc ribbon domain-containing protein [Gemmatimonadota bacterium]